DEKRNTYRRSGGYFRGLCHIGGGISFDSRLRFFHLHYDMGGQRNAHWSAPIKGYSDGRAVHQKARVVPDRFTADTDLLACIRVHEDVGVAFWVNVLQRLVDDICRLELFARANVSLQNTTRQKVLHLRSSKRLALA